MPEEIDLETWRIMPTDRIPQKRIPSRKERERGKYWVQFPEAWTKRLADIRATGSTYRLAIYLLRRRRMTNSPTITVSNAALELDGIGRKGKAAAIKELMKADLIAVEYRDRKSPIVTLLPIR